MIIGRYSVLSFRKLMGVIVTGVEVDWLVLKNHLGAKRLKIECLKVLCNPFVELEIVDNGFRWFCKRGNGKSLKSRGFLKGHSVL